jgi:hypothetical protein
MVVFYSPRPLGVSKPNAVHEQQAQLRRYYRSVGVSAVAAALDQMLREISPLEAENAEQVVLQLERKAA